jgi:type VI secretion system protein ImpA
LLLERAKRLVFANFVELMTDLAPDALPQIESLRGRTPSVEEAK